MSIILGVDPGLGCTGWGVLKKSSEFEYMSSGTIETNSRSSIFDRIRKIYDGLNSVICAYSPVFVMLEKIFVNNNMGSSLNFAYARGGIMLTLALHHLTIMEIAPNLMKKIVTGNGHATKQQIRYMVESILRIKLDEKKSDVYDALALALSFCDQRTSAA